MECLLGREIKEGYVINHIDGDKGNNLPSNLEEVTISRNTKHAYDNNLAKAKKGSDNTQSKLTQKDVEKIFELRRDGEKVSSIAVMFEISPKTVYAILGKKRWKHVG
jgi:DNA invertase Pin-like site-specific DNA recombinase